MCWCFVEIVSLESKWIAYSRLCSGGHHQELRQLGSVFWRRSAPARPRRWCDLSAVAARNEPASQRFCAAACCAPANTTAPGARWRATRQGSICSRCGGWRFTFHAPSTQCAQTSSVPPHFSLRCDDTVRPTFSISPHTGFESRGATF